MISNNFSVNNSHNYSPNFKGVNLVKISKKAFENPNDIVKAELAFQFHTDRFLEKEGLLDGFRELFSLFSGRKNPRKTFSFLETPNYTNNVRLLKENGLGNCSLDWLAKNTGLNIGPKNPDKHTFYILTGNDKDIAAKLASIPNRLKEGLKIDRATQKGNVQYEALLNSKIDEQIFDAIKDAPFQKFDIQSLDEIEQIAKKINLNI